MNDRRNSQSNDVVSFGPFSLFAAERLLKKADEPIPVSYTHLDVYKRQVAAKKLSMKST